MEGIYIFSVADRGHTVRGNLEFGELRYDSYRRVEFPHGHPEGRKQFDKFTDEIDGYRPGAWGYAWHTHKWEFPPGIADGYEFGYWLAQRTTPKIGDKRKTEQFAWRMVGDRKWRFWHGELPLEQQTKTAARLNTIRGSAVNIPFRLDGSDLQSAALGNQLNAIIQAVNLHRDAAGQDWRVLEVLDKDHQIRYLDTLKEAVEFCEHNIAHNIALHSARTRAEHELHKLDAALTAAVAGYETLTADQVDDYQARTQAARDQWFMYDIDATIRRHTEYALEHAEVVHADPDKVLQQAKELVESVAAARRRWIVGALDEQASHIDGSCPSQQNALTGLALVKQEALRELDRSEEDGITRIRAVRDTYLDRIRRYEVLHSPIWSVRGVQDSGIARFDWTPVNATSAGDDIPLGLPIAVANPDIDKTDYGNIAVGLEFPDGEVGVQQPFTINRKPRPNGQVVVKLRGGLPDDTPPFGRHRMRLTARNECGPADLLVDILRREPLVSDPDFETLDHTTPAWTWTAGTPETVAVTPPDGVERKGLRLVDNDDQQERLFYSGLVPVDHSAEYQVSVSAKQPTGDRIAYLFVEFFEDSAGKIPMNLQWYEADKKARQVPAGWAGVGSFFYWGVAGFQFPPDWTHYAMTFGRDGKADIPPEAQAMRVGAILAWTGTTETEVLLTDYQVTKV